MNNVFIGNTMSSGIFMGHVLRAGGGRSGDLLIADLVDLEKNIASEADVKRIKYPEVQVTTVHGKDIFPCDDESLKQQGHDVSRPLRHRQLHREDAGAGGNSHAADQRPLPRRQQAGGNTNADGTLPKTPQFVEREATEDKGDVWIVSCNYVYRRHVAPRGHLYMFHVSHRSRALPSTST